MDMFDYCIIILFIVALIAASIINPGFTPVAIAFGSSMLVVLLADSYFKYLRNASIKKENERKALKQELMIYIDNKIKENKESEEEIIDRDEKTCR